MKGIFIPLITYAGRRIEKRKFTDSPVYIGGCGRSGTTLLLSILSAHKDIFACPKELNLFDGAEVKNGKISAPKFYRLYRTLIQKKINPGAKRYCEKSPSNIHYIDIIDKYHDGEFKMIQIIRDGRDVILSRHPRKNNGFWVEPERWVRDVTTGLNYIDHPSVFTIRYEDLINEYQATIAGLCNFLEIELSEEILNWHTHTTVRKNNALYRPIDPIKKSSIGKWKKPEYAERVKSITMDKTAASLLKKLYYLTDD